MLLIAPIPAHKIYKSLSPRSEGLGLQKDLSILCSNPALVRDLTKIELYLQEILCGILLPIFKKIYSKLILKWFFFIL